MMTVGGCATNEELQNLEKWLKEIIALDPDNRAGLKEMYEFRLLFADVQNLIREGKADEAQSAADKVLALPGITGEQKQNVLLLRHKFISPERPPKRPGFFLKKAVEAALGSPRTAPLKMWIQDLEKK